jgi:hypothetical protein
MTAHVPDVIPAIQSGMVKTSLMGSKTALLVAMWSCKCFPHVSKNANSHMFCCKESLLSLELYA